MCSDSSSSVVVRNSEYLESKENNPTILIQLGEFIAFNCSHGAKNPMAVEQDGKIVQLCCLKCAVEFILKDRAKGKITSR